MILREADLLHERDIQSCPVEKLTDTYQNVNPYEEVNNSLQRLNPRIGTMNDILFSKPTP
jgi:hypothetical protein